MAKEARLAHGAREAMRVQTALEVASEFILHVRRQALARALVRVLEEAFQVLLDDAVQDRRFWATLLVLLRVGSGHRAQGCSDGRADVDECRIRRGFSSTHPGERQGAALASPVRDGGGGGRG
jgi:hypothetical protein